MIYREVRINSRGTAAQKSRPDFGPDGFLLYLESLVSQIVNNVSENLRISGRN